MDGGVLFGFEVKGSAQQSFCRQLAPFNGTNGILNPQIRFVQFLDETWRYAASLVPLENITDDGSGI